MNALIFEQNADISNLLKALIKKCDSRANVVFARSTEELLVQLESSRRFSVVVADVDELPDDGLLRLKRLKNLPTGPTVLLISAWGDSDTSSEIKAFRVDEFGKLKSAIEAAVAKSTDERTLN